MRQQILSQPVFHAPLQYQRGAGGCLVFSDNVRKQVPKLVAREQCLNGRFFLCGENVRCIPTYPAIDAGKAGETFARRDGRYEWIREVA